MRHPARLTFRRHAGGRCRRLRALAANLALSLRGSGGVNSRGLQADDVSVNVAGSADASVSARKTLNVAIAGSGNVVYVGDAAVSTSIAGSGSVRRQ